MPYRFEKDKRILRSRDFSSIIRNGNCVANETLVLYARKAEDADSIRIGVTIPKKMGSAVLRNRWKRLIREAFRRQLNEIPTGYDYVVRPKRGAIADWNHVAPSLIRLARRAVSQKRQQNSRQA